MMTGRLIDAAEALSIGAVSRVVPRAELDDAVDEVVGLVTAHSPAVMMLGRDSFYGVVGMGHDAAFDRLQADLTEVSLTKDSQEGIRAFMEKREPVWSGR
jgi:enoyl-CoA hydratase/carnithine racemase